MAAAARKGNTIGVALPQTFFILRRDMAYVFRNFTPRPSLAALLSAGLLLVGLTVLPGGAWAQSSGLPLPRFVSLRADEVNLRTGPGVQYPVDWIFRKSGLPLEVIAEYQSWRKVRDQEGALGWVHQSVLSGRRTMVVTGAVQTIRRRADETAAVVARAEGGVIGRLMECPDGGTWCQVDVDGFKGWLPRTAFWGVLDGETVK